MARAGGTCPHAGGRRSLPRRRDRAASASTSASARSTPTSDIDLAVARGHDPRHRRRERRRQVDADVDPLRLLPGRQPARSCVDGKPVAIRAPAATRSRAGIGMVHQHFMLVEPFTVLENVMLGAEGGAAAAPAASRTARAELARLERDYGLEVDPDAIVGELPVGLQQRVEILKALYRGADILILDEPTARADAGRRPTSSSASCAALKAQGKTVVLITHKLREIMAVTDQRLGHAPRRDGGDARHRRDHAGGAGRADGRPPGAAAGREGRRRSRARRARGREPVGRRRRAACARGRRRLASTCAPARSSASPASPATARPSCSRRLPASAGRRSARIRLDGTPIDRAGAAIRTRCAGSACCMCRRTGSAWGWCRPFEACENAILGFTDEPRLRRRAAPRSRAAMVDGPCGRRWSATTCARRAPRLQDRQLLRRQPAEDRAGARDRARPEGAAGRPADARRRHRRHRVHPPPADRACATPARRSCWSRSSSTRSSPLRPHPGDVRRPHHRRAPARRDRRARPRPADGRDRGGGVMEPRSPLSPSASPIS